MSTERHQPPLSQPGQSDATLMHEQRDQLSVQQRRLLDRSIELVFEMRRSAQATFESQPSVIALAGRNAAVTIDNVFGGEFRVYQPLEAIGEDFSIELDELTKILENLETTFDMLVGQMPVQPHREATKVAVPHQLEIITEYRKLLERLFRIRETRLRFGTHRIDVMMQLMQQLYVFWQKVHPMISAPTEKN